jgi:tRNA G37 N-methylase Trm5
MSVEVLIGDYSRLCKLSYDENEEVHTYCFTYFNGDDVWAIIEDEDGVRFRTPMEEVIFLESLAAERKKMGDALTKKQDEMLASMDLSEN